jgi:hypothetical protein
MPANRQSNSNFFNYSALTDSQSQRNTAAAGDAPVVTIEKSQATPPNPVSNQPANPLNITSDDDGNAWAPTGPGVGAGTSSNSYDARGNDDTPPASSNSAQQTVNQSFSGQTIIPQPNVLDQYASYTYAISWWILTPDQYNNLSSGLAPAPGTGTWSLLIQSGGASISGRSQFFPNDYYLDDLEIDTFLMGKGTNMSTNGMEIKFKVVEPNGITLIQNLYRATVAAYGQTGQPPNYGAAQYCLTIEFYGYDDQGKLIAPATGQNTTNGQFSSINPSAVIKKYYPFLIENITFRTVANQVEYMVVGKPIPYATGAAQARGTIPFAFALAGQTVSQILQGGSIGSSATASDPGARTDSPNPLTQSTPISADSAETAALFNDGTGYTPGYDPAAGWSA